MSLHQIVSLVRNHLRLSPPTIHNGEELVCVVHRRLADAEVTQVDLFVEIDVSLDLHRLLKIPVVEEAHQLDDEAGRRPLYPILALFALPLSPRPRPYVIRAAEKQGERVLHGVDLLFNPLPLRTDLVEMGSESVK